MVKPLGIRGRSCVRWVVNAELVSRTEAAFVPAGAAPPGRLLDKRTEVVRALPTTAVKLQIVMGRVLWPHTYALPAIWSRQDAEVDLR